MKIYYWLGILLFGVIFILAAGDPAQAQIVDTTPEPVDDTLPQANSASENYPFNPKDVVNRSAASLGPIRGQINVANSDTSEEFPSIALCASDQYLVVYVMDKKIYGQRLESDGDLLGNAFLISSDSNKNYEPDVACDWFYDRFIVSWTYDYYGDASDYDVHARGVWGDYQDSGSQLYGSELSVTQASVIDEEFPSIACNSDDHSCLVVFNYNNSGSYDIYGQRVAVGASDISNQGTRFSISSFTASEHYPDVTWGGYDDDFLVAWQYYHSTYNRIVYAFVWDTNQSGSQIEKGGTWLINPGTFDHEQDNATTAYNRYTRQYLAAFQYDWKGDSTDWDIYALRLTPGEDPLGSAIPIATTGCPEDIPAVAFSGGTQSITGGLGADQFLVTYRRNCNGDVYNRFSQAVKGTYDAVDSDQLEGNPLFIGYKVYIDADVAGSINNGRYLAVWERFYSDTDVDIVGQMISPYISYLPYLLRP